MTVTLTRYAGNPVFTRGTSGQWDDDTVAGEQVFWDIRLERYVMAYVGIDAALGSGGVIKFGLAYSDDLITWTREATNPVFTPNATEGHIATADIIQITPTSYYMYYQSYGGADGGARIYAASSTDMLTWTRLNGGVAILTPGAGAAWDNEYTFDPDPHYIDGTVYLFYGGQKDSAGTKTRGIGLATATDFLTFTKSASNPLITPAVGESHLALGAPSVVGDIAGNDYQVYYDISVPAAPTERFICRSDTTNGTTFTHNHQVLTPTSATSWGEGVQVFDSAAIVVNGAHYQFYAGSDSDGLSTGLAPDIGLALLQPRPGVFVDLGNDGSFDDATSPEALLARMMPEARSVQDEITSYVLDVSWSYGGSADHVSGANPGQATIRVKNSDGRFNPDNASGPYYGLLKPNRRVWVGLNADGSITGTGQQVFGIFAGYIRQIVPLVEDGATAIAEIICEDALGAYSRRPVKVAAATDYTYRSLREAILDDIGETNTDLAFEVDTLPLAAADSDNALAVLEEINKATGSRHWANVADDKDEFSSYTVVDRHHKLGSSAQAALNADDIQAISGYRVTEETIVNLQQVDVSQAQFPAGIDTIWTYAEASFPLTVKRTIWAQFEDFVKDATLDYTSTGGAVTTSLTNFGTTAKIELWSASSSVVSNLTIEGRQVVRDSTEAVTAEDTTSQATYGKRSGGSVSSTYSSTPALAQGLADFVVWKFAQPLTRPGITQINEFTTMLQRDLYDVVTLTVDRLSVVARRYEIIGISGAVEMAGTSAKLTTITWELQETNNQSALDLFMFDESAFDGADVLAR